MKTYGLTYGDLNFHNSRKLAFESLQPKVDECFLKTEEDLKKYFEEHISVLKYGKGSGYWLFKYLFLREMFQLMREGDGVIYMDAGIRRTGEIDIFFEIAKENRGFCLFKQAHKNLTYTKRDCFVLTGCDTPYYHNEYQCDACIQIYIKNPATESFLADMYMACKNPRIVTDEPNIQHFENLEGFHDHRHDQSVLSLMCLKNKIDRFKIPTQCYPPVDSKDHLIFNENEVKQSAKYGVCFDHHRYRV